MVWRGKKRKQKGVEESKPCLFLPVNICPNDRQTNQALKAKIRQINLADSKQLHEGDVGNFHPASVWEGWKDCDPWLRPLFA